MKVAFLCLAHNNISYLEYLAKYCCSDGDYFFVHIDSACTEKASFGSDRVVFISDDIRVRTRWGTIRIVDATLILLKKALETAHFDRFVLISGSDLPLLDKSNFKATISGRKEYVSVWEVVDKKNNARNRNFFRYHNYNSLLTNIGEAQSSGSRIRIHIARLVNSVISLIPNNKLTYDRYAKGSQWWCITNSFAKYVIKKSENLSFRYEFSKMHAPDEIYFQTILINSKFKENSIEASPQCSLKHGIHFIDWGVNSDMPGMKKFSIKDISRAIDENCLFARKVDFNRLGDYVEYICKLN